MVHEQMANGHRESASGIPRIICAAVDPESLFPPSNKSNTAQSINNWPKAGQIPFHIK